MSGQDGHVAVAVAVAVYVYVYVYVYVHVHDAGWALTERHWD